jgi:hypothetical protein
MRLADWIMRNLTRHAPAERQDWARAMQAEYDAMSDQRLSWALGCWRAVLEWRIRAEGPYLAVLLVIAILSASRAVEGLIIRGLVDAGLQGASVTFAMATGVFPSLVAIFVYSAIVSTWRPDRALLTGATLTVGPHLLPLILLLTDPGIRDQMLNNGPWRSYASPMFVALGAEIGWCFVGSQLGAILHQSMRRQRNSSRRGGPNCGAQAPVL